ncbi:MAG: NifU family protein [Proteobacteria bacterium]|nr:NifU family protein [Desulfobacterales bacterium]MBL6967674.1 NifU family protein [Desulfobacteraceae bacterium]MBU0732591.1 NifU family protein [Pseudomonadota bacterium]MBL7171375.1 NifU family protein [Desulfobacteraceae bacterium]MBU0989738.1 NifU family protein [Pseudomonadota bacterium]
MTLREKIEGALQKVRPSLQADGGDVQLVDVDQDGLVKVKLMGACGGCPMSQMTLKMGIEKILKQNVPEVTGVQSV